MKPPSENQVQIILFGPGIGESILIHLGNSNWVIVDSCKVGEEPAALSYLKKINVNVKSDVKLIVVTHWDTDHTIGIQNILSECENAEFAIPNVLEENQYEIFLIANEFIEEQKTAGINQNILKECLKILNDRNKVPLYLTENLCMWERDAKNFSHKRDVKLVALSPSSFRYNEFLKNVFNKMYDASNYKNAVSENSNLYSVAMQVSIGEFNILLGADLMAVSNSNCGWNNIIRNQKIKSEKSNVYQMYKVAHHGSKNSYQEDIWTSLFSKELVSIMTPKRNNNLPDLCVTKKIIERSKNTYITNGYYISPNCIEIIKDGKKSQFTEYAGDKTNESFVCITIEVKKCNRMRVKLGEYANQLKYENGNIILDNVIPMSKIEKIQTELICFLTRSSKFIQRIFGYKWK